jgi:hypothetical protein
MVYATSGKFWSMYGPTVALERDGDLLLAQRLAHQSTPIWPGYWARPSAYILRIQSSAARDWPSDGGRRSSVSMPPP